MFLSQPALDEVQRPENNNNKKEKKTDWQHSQLAQNCLSKQTTPGMQLRKIAQLLQIPECFGKYRSNLLNLSSPTPVLHSFESK